MKNIDISDKDKSLTTSMLLYGNFLLDDVIRTFITTNTIEYILATHSSS